MSDSNTQRISQLSGKEQERLGIPPFVKFYSCTPFSGMNQEDSRTALQDNEFYWQENFILLGKGKLRTIWDRGTTLYTAPVGLEIIYFKWFNINSTTSCAVFLSDGTAVQVGLDGTVTTISAASGTFFVTGQLPVAHQSGSLFLLIANNLTPNSYWVWDGTILYSAGTIGPYVIGDIIDAGSGYTSPPALTFFGGAGTGVAGTATVINGSIVAITITNPGSGFTPADSIVQVGFTGGGSDNGAILQANISPGNIDSVQVTTGGFGYQSPPIVGFIGGGGTGFTATATISANGVVTAVNILTAGSGFVTTPVITFTGGGGSGAKAIAVLSSGFLVSVDVIDGGTGFTGTPTLTISGGGGTGAAATAVMSNGTIASVTTTNGGSGYTSAPNVQVQSGLNNAAQATINVMPFGISGTSIETFQGRVWISNPASVPPVFNGGVFNVSAPSTITDFATSNGGLLFTNSDAFLRQQYVAMHQSNGYLYPIGDSSVSVISNVQTSGTPTTTTFNYQNTSAQIGAAWRDTVQDYGQAVLFANSNGINGLYGGAVSRVSKKMDGLFVNDVQPPVPGSVTPSAAVANIYTIPVYLLNITIIDPFTQQPRTVMMAWDEKNWFIASQTSTLTFIGTREIDSVMTAWGTDALSLFPLFSVPSSKLASKLSTKMFGGEREYIIKQPMTVHIRATDLSSDKSGVAGSVVTESNGVAQQVGQPPQAPPENFPIPIQPNFIAPLGSEQVWGADASGVQGTSIGLTISTLSKDILISGLAMSYQDIASVFG